MKAATTVLLTALLALPAGAQSQPGDFEPVDETTTSPRPVSEVLAELDRRVDAELQQMAQQARDRGIDRETFNRAVNALQARAEFGRQSFEQSADVWESLSQAVARLETQARSAYNDLFEVHTFQMQVIERRLDMAIEDLRDEANSRGVSRELFNRHVQLLEARAAAADNFGPTARNIHNRLSAQIEVFLSRAIDGTASMQLFQDMRLSMLRERLNEALYRLQQAAVFRGATREDYNRVAEAYEALAAAQAEEIQGLGY